MRHEEMLRGYLGRFPDVDHARRMDPLAQAQVTILRHFLATMESAMEDEGVESAVIRHVLQIVLYGGMPNPTDAAERAHVRDQRIHDAMHGDYPQFPGGTDHA